MNVVSIHQKARDQKRREKLTESLRDHARNLLSRGYTVGEVAAALAVVEDDWAKTARGE